MTDVSINGYGIAFPAFPRGEALREPCGGELGSSAATTLKNGRGIGETAGRTNAYVEAQPGNATGLLCAELSWTDDFAFQPAGGSAVAFLGPPGAAGDFGQTVIMVHAKTHTPITVEVPILTNVGCNIPPNYSLFVTVEELPKK